MNDSWGIYEIKDRSQEIGSKQARPWSLRWRVDGQQRRRSFETKGHAKTFRDELLKAQLFGWNADARGWPIDPKDKAPHSPQPASTPGTTFATYAEQEFWPTVSPGLGDKNRLGHRRNLELAVDLLTYRRGDPRVGDAPRLTGSSILLSDLTSDDLRRAVAERRTINGRTRAANARALARAIESANGAPVDFDPRPETASTATVRSFFITLGLIVKAAISSGKIDGNPLASVEALAPKPKPKRMTARLVPTLDEIFDLADAISELGPRTRDGHPAGARYRSLILTAGTTAARPGELVAHQPDWFNLTADAPTILISQTEAAIYDTKANLSGRRSRSLKHREDGEAREVPLIPPVVEALRLHLENGWSSDERMWLSPTGQGHLDWGNIQAVYWRPALERIFAGTAKADLVHMEPKTLRKAAVTWWQDNGISPYLAAEWAGHSPEVARLHYASRATADFAPELRRLTRASSG